MDYYIATDIEEEIMKIFVNTVNGNLCFSLHGELDECSSSAVRSKIDDILDKREYLSVTFDLENLSFMDSTGIGVIIGRYKKLKPKNVPIYVLNPSKQVDKILTTSGLYKIMKKIS